MLFLSRRIRKRNRKTKTFRLFTERSHLCAVNSLRYQTKDATGLTCVIVVMVRSGSRAIHGVVPALSYRYNHSLCLGVVVCDSQARHIDSATLVRFFSIDAEGLEESFSQFAESWTNFGCSIGQVGNPRRKRSNSKKLAQLIAEVTAILADHIVFPTRPALGHLGNQFLHFRWGQVRATHVNRLSVGSAFGMPPVGFRIFRDPSKSARSSTPFHELPQQHGRLQRRKGARPH